MTNDVYCPIHKTEKLAPLSSPIEAKPAESVFQGAVTVLRCAVPGCPVLHSMQIAPDWGGFFKLDADGTPIRL
jgi:hypothetical protein